jgi:hypothetical protein
VIRLRWHVSLLVLALTALATLGCCSAVLAMRPVQDPQRQSTEDELRAVASVLEDELAKVNIHRDDPKFTAWMRRDSAESDDLDSLWITGFEGWPDEDHRFLVELLVSKGSGMAYVAIIDRRYWGTSTAYDKVENAVWDALARFPDLDVVVVPGVASI